MHRQWLSKVAQDTEHKIKEVVNRFPIDANYCIRNTKYFADYNKVAILNKAAGKYKELSKKSYVDVLNKDTIEYAFEMKKNKYNPLVLNMASDTHPGGGWRKGAMAQEEELFRRSTYVTSLEQPDILIKYKWPLLAGIYSPRVIVFRGTNSEGYPMYKWQDCKSLDFMAVAAMRDPKLDKINNELRMNDEDVAVTENKIRLIFETALHYGNDSVVLGSLGCGAFHNPPKHSAEIFKKIIGEYDKYLKYIGFGILTDRNDKYGNYENFKNVLSKN